MTDSLAVAAYRPRRTRTEGLTHRDGWAVKRIGITVDDKLPGEAELAAAMDAAAGLLPPVNETGAAFLVVHRGEEALWALMGWWELDILYQRLFRAELGTTRFERVGPDGPTACVWELVAVAHERDAWVRHVLGRPEEPDLAGYLAAGLCIEPA
ncbi:hypothetical protein [Amycolatopsis suaedae]|uniref:Uncharacterized protein n=1 Tax=Amycolatopsis suaedae TaxID=2510978 RepID=A0A4V2ELD7_9PSEU|nr:hypothetical protein [Amycolatopsis suaedae]RZQ61205.1 hypothetical protein EWH70_25360 [Amycolatopsis suaedae]